MLTSGDILLKNIERTIYNTLNPLGEQILQNVPPVFRGMIDMDSYVELGTDFAMQYIEPYVRQLENYKVKKTGDNKFDLNEIKFVTKEVTEQKIEDIFEKMEKEYDNTLQ